MGFWSSIEDIGKTASEFSPIGQAKKLFDGQGGGGGAGSPMHADKKLKKEGLAYAGLDTAGIQAQIGQAGEQQRQGNIAAYNAAIASQRGVNPTAAAMSMGQNLSGINAQTGASTQMGQAQVGLQGGLANQQALLDYYRTLSGAGAQRDIASTQADVARRGQNMDFFGKIAGGAAAGAGAAIAGSDENMKQPIDHEETLSRHMSGKQQMAANGPKSTEDFLDTLKPQEYEYKPGTIGDDGGKAHTGVMAQDLEKTPQGAGAVIDTPDGKMVDVRQLASLLAASVGDLHMRISQLEGRGKQYG